MEKETKAGYDAYAAGITLLNQLWDGTKLPTVLIPAARLCSINLHDPYWGSAERLRHQKEYETEPIKTWRLAMGPKIRGTAIMGPKEPGQYGRLLKLPPASARFLMRFDVEGTKKQIPIFHIDELGIACNRVEEAATPIFPNKRGSPPNEHGELRGAIEEFEKGGHLYGTITIQEPRHDGTHTYDVLYRPAELLLNLLIHAQLQQKQERDWETVEEIGRLLLHLIVKREPLVRTTRGQLVTPRLTL